MILLSLVATGRHVTVLQEDLLRHMMPPADKYINELQAWRDKGSAFGTVTTGTRSIGISR